MNRMRPALLSRRPLLLLILAAFNTAGALAQEGRIVYEVKSRYQRITVWDAPDGYRQLIFDGNLDGTDAVQSEMNPAKPNELTLDYAKHMIAALPLVTKPDKILVVGLGGACIQRYLHGLLPKTTIETAELDPAVVDVARRFFFFKEDECQRVHVGDGRKFIEQSKDKYDIIMLDAFSADSIPYMLATKEFLKLCQEHLVEGGIVCANLWYEAADYQDMLKTYAAVFTEWHVLRCPDSTNAVLVALPTQRNLTARKWMDLAKTFDQSHPTGLNLARIIDRAIEQNPRIPADAKVLLDADADKRK